MLSEEEIIKEIQEFINITFIDENMSYYQLMNKYLIDLYNKEKEKNKSLNLKNQALYESINCNDDNMLARRYDRLQKELEQEKEKNNRQLEIDTAEEVLKWKGKYHLLSRKINGVLEDKIKDKIKELEEQCETELLTTWLESQIEILKELLEGE